ncbi:MAG: hypothetical protein V1667_03930 [bacterium]
MNRKIIMGLKILIILSVTALTALIYFQKGDFSSIDLGRHLKNGQTVWSNPDVLYKNFYSYAEPDFPFINHHWLSGAIFWLFYLIGGFKFLTALNIIIGISAVFIIFKLTAKKSDFVLASILILPAILLLSERVDIRPEMFSYLFIAISYYLVEDLRANGYGKKLIWLAPMFLIWANLHIYFFIGLFLASLAMLEQLILKTKDAKNFFYITLSSWAACLLTPNFIKGLLYPFNILKKYGYEIAENKSPFYMQNLTVNYNIEIFKILLVLLAASFAVRLVKRKIDFYDLAVALFFSALACLYIRNLPLFGLMVLPIVARNYFAFFQNFNQKRIMMLAIVLAVYFFVFYSVIRDNYGEKKFISKNFGLGVEQASVDSIKFYKNNNLSGPIFNNYDFGGALIFWLFPSEKVFVDNRPEAYSVNFFNQTYKPMMQDESKWREFSGKYGINLIYFTHTDGTPWAKKFLAARLRDENWPLIYFDNYAVIMAKSNEKNEDIIKKYKIDGQKFSSRIGELSQTAGYNEKLYLADFSEIYGNSDLAKSILNGILSDSPNNGKILAFLGYLYSDGYKNQDILKSLDYFNKAIDNGYKLPGIYNQMGLNYWALADYGEAKNMWQKALRFDSGNEHAKYYLDQADRLIK